jgi:regulator of cell morphogenesis and NO signaling
MIIETDLQRRASPGRKVRMDNKIFTMPLASLCDRIETTHHADLRKELPRLLNLAGEVAGEHARSDGRLAELRDVLAEFAAELEDHMLKEERILFPAIRALEKGGTSPDFHCGSLAHPMAKMANEHEDASLMLMQMSLLADGFEPPGWAGPSHRALFAGLFGLTSALRIHIDEEERALFPRVRDLENAGA